MKKVFDVLVVGGGVMGSSVAYHLLSFEPKLKVGVIERDPTYERASTSLCLGGVRVQFSLRENILMSLYAQDCFSRFEQEMAVNGEKPSIGFRREGYLFLIDDAGRKAAEAAMDLQTSLSAKVEWWGPERIRGEYPLLSTEGFAGGTFGPGDGYVDPYAVLMGFRRKSVSLGAEFLPDEAVGLGSGNGRVESVILKSGEVLVSEIVVNAAGPWAGEVARTAGVEIPVSPARRQVFAVKPESPPEKPIPLVIAPSGLYFRSETGGLVLVGKSMDEDPAAFDFRWDWARFTDALWPELLGIVPAWERLKLVRGWAGLYEMNLLDCNALLGEWPELSGFYLINGFSGHGLQQSPAAGRYVAELILRRSPSLDLGCFSPRRVLERRPLGEGAVV
ncbi:MAG TPA: FAD-binding oxidoreductase [Thermodesulfobacteriota bacterium]|nr:FAD-binding oxidoreductase [Thermodesulfobacteriota bacterium]